MVLLQVSQQNVCSSNATLGRCSLVSSAASVRLDPPWFRSTRVTPGRCSLLIWTASVDRENTRWQIVTCSGSPTVALSASGHVPPWRLRFFSLCSTFCCLVWFGRPTMPMSYWALFVQPYSLWSDTITGYNGACAKVNVVFTARRYALAQSLLSAGVRPSVCPPHSCTVLYPDGWRYHQTSFSAR